MQLQCQFALITETWFTDKQQDSVVSIAGYSLYRRDRYSGKGVEFVHMFAVTFIVLRLFQMLIQYVE